MRTASVRSEQGMVDDLSASPLMTCHRAEIEITSILGRPGTYVKPRLQEPLCNYKQVAFYVNLPYLTLPVLELQRACFDRRIGQRVANFRFE